MADVLALTAAELLAIPEAEPERLFTGDAAAAKDERNRLAKRWHPDRNPGVLQAAAVIAHVNRLYDLAEKKLADGSWRTPGLLELHGVDGTLRRVRYRRRHQTEMGELYYGDSKAVFLVRTEFADLFEAGRKRITGLAYGSPRMKAEVSRFLPQVRATFETKDGYCVMVQDKTPDVFLLADVLAALGGRMDPRHVAWIVSRLLNLACFLEFNKLTHNALAVDTCFVSPKHHSILLLGGWWYATPAGARLNALPEAHLPLLPHDIRRTKAASPRFDLMLVRHVGRALLGDPSGGKLRRDSTIPAPLLRWLLGAGTGVARLDFEGWQQVLTDSFGARRFVELAVSESDVFKEPSHG